VSHTRPDPDLERLKLAEALEAFVWTDAVEAAPAALREALGLRAVPIADGVALVMSKVWSILYNRAFGFGLARPVTGEEVSAAIGLYRIDRPFAIQPTPMAMPAEVHDWLGHRGLVVRHHWVRWWRDAAPAPDARIALKIERIGRSRAAEFLAVAGAIFEEPLEVLPWMGHTIGREGWTHYVALDDGRVVGTAAMLIRGDGAWLGWGGTLRSHRGRGVQSAMVARRIEDARAKHVQWLTVETAPDLPERPNPSYRNVERAGFRVLCLRPSHAWTPPSEATARA